MIEGGKHLSLITVDLRDRKQLYEQLIDNIKNLAQIIYDDENFKEYKFTKAELLRAAEAAEVEYQNFKKDIRKKVKKQLNILKKTIIRLIE